ncbi:MAG: hypothetical protein HQK53_17865 [Oligoflexia bacterium]|nr:hypothetical protein [Oligoflexia bacterium]
MKISVKISMKILIKILIIPCLCLLLMLLQSIGSIESLAQEKGEQTPSSLRRAEFAIDQQQVEMQKELWLRLTEREENIKGSGSDPILLDRDFCDYEAALKELIERVHNNLEGIYHQLIEELPDELPDELPGERSDDVPQQSLELKKRIKNILTILARAVREQRARRAELSRQSITIRQGAWIGLLGG